MQTKPAINSAVVIGLVAVLIVAKRGLVHVRPAPLRSDPCDAVNAFAILVILLIAIGSLIRPFLPRWRHSEPALRHTMVVRTQQAIILAVFLILVADAVALVQHPMTWFNEPSRNTVVLLLVILVLAAVLAQLTTIAAWRGLDESSSFPWKRLMQILALVAAMLAICPEWPNYSSTATAHTLTVVCGAIVAFVPFRFVREMGLTAELQNPRRFARGEWVSLIIGLSMAAFAFWWSIAIGNRGILPYVHVPSALISLAGLLIAYAFLGSPLGLTMRRPYTRQSSQ